MSESKMTPAPDLGYRDGDWVLRYHSEDAIREYGQQCAEAARAPLLQRIAELEGAMQADDERLRTAAARVGITAGCDAAEWMSDEIERNRARIAELEAANRDCVAHFEQMREERDAYAASDRIKSANIETIAEQASRYRQIRDGEGWPAAFGASSAPEPLRGWLLDAAVDIARQREPAKESGDA